MIKNLSLSKKISFSFAVLFVVALGMGLTVYRNIASVDAAAERQELHADLKLVASDMRFAMTRQENSLRGFLLTQDKYYSDRVAKHHQTFQGFLAKARAVAAGQSDLMAKLDGLERQMNG